jgi:hypothetical protein
MTGINAPPRRVSIIAASGFTEDRCEPESSSVISMVDITGSTYP